MGNRQSRKVHHAVMPKTILDEYDSVVQQGGITEVDANAAQFSSQKLRSSLRKLDQSGKEYSLSLSGEKLGDYLIDVMLHHLTRLKNGSQEWSTNGSEGREEGPISPVTLISLRGNMLTSAISPRIHELLTTSKFINLVALDLSMNNIDDDGVRTICLNLLQNTTLRLLDLSNNQIGSIGFDCLAEAVYQNKSILSLNLTGNKEGNEDTQTILLAAASNYHLTDLRLDLRGESANLQLLREIMERNDIIRSILHDLITSSTKRQFRVKMNRLAMESSTLHMTANRGDRATSNFSALSSSTTDSAYEKSDLTSSISSYTETQYGIPMPMSSPRLYQAAQMRGQMGFIPVEAPDIKVTQPVRRYEYGAFETRGRRMQMEDVTVIHGDVREGRGEDVFVVLDGHGGRAAADFVAENFVKTLISKLDSLSDCKSSMKETFTSINQDMTSRFVHCGATAAVVFLQQSHLIAANIGDTRIIAFSDTMSSEGDIRSLSEEHKPSTKNEYDRVMSLGGTIKEGRLCGVLAVTRAFGDAFFSPYVCAEPALFELPLDDLQTGNWFIVLATDGVWDVMSNKEVADHVLDKAVTNHLASVSKSLVEAAHSKGSTDNISATIIRIFR
eukprot:TRINITY_DN8940_c0_g1_i2.p1 TRINITY_DN8940_c0_g1~~TRINITY_DN8940_c0_g1_i2.p1  ORF type:complete len:615 (+),score=118.70 TRINITY_DN8940_c0_g1_i2:57-1901(+)